MFWMDPEGAKIGGSYLWNNEVDLPYPMLAIVEATSRRIMMIPHPSYHHEQSTISFIHYLIGSYQSLSIGIDILR